VIQDQFDTLAGAAIVVSGLVVLRRPRSWVVGVALVLAGVSWLGPLVGDSDLSSRFLHRALLAVALASAALPGLRWHPLLAPLVVFAVVCVAPQWATAPWVNSLSWVAVLISIGAMVWPSPRRRRLLPAMATFTVMLVVSTVGVRLSSLSNDTRRLLYHFAAAATAALITRAARSPITPDVAFRTRAGSPWSIGIRGVDDPEFVTADGRRIETVMTKRMLEFDVGELGTAVLAHDDPAFDDLRVRSQLSRAVKILAERAALRRRTDAQSAAVDQSRRRVLAADHEASMAMIGEVEREVQPHFDAIAELLAHAAVCDDTRARRLLAEVEAETRALCSGALPAQLSHGLGRSLHLLGERSLMPATVRTDDVELDGVTARALFMVASEAMANALKHSGADRLTIELIDEGSTVALRVADDGVGGVMFSQSGGLAEMRRRVAELGGAVDVESDESSGTVVTARVERPV